MLLSDVLTITSFFDILLNVLSNGAYIQFVSKNTVICITRLFFYKLAGDRVE